MSDEEEVEALDSEAVSFYILPTTEGQPPIAVLLVVCPDCGGHMVPTDQKLSWSNDLGSWIDPNGVPALEGLNDMLKEHAHNLEIEGF